MLNAARRPKNLQSGNTSKFWRDINIVNFEILANEPPFLRNENVLGLSSPVRESGTPVYPKSLKMLPIDFSSEKTRRANFFVISTLGLGFT